MKKRIPVFILAAAYFVVCLATAPQLFGTTRYIAQSAGTFSGGKACNGQTAITPSTFNGITNSPGDVNYICGTITGSANSNLLSIQGNGASGNPITILWDTGAILQAPYFSSSLYGISGNGAAYVILDGGTNGIIQNTANGTGKTYQQASTLIGGFGSNFTVKNLSILNVYVHTINDGNGDAAWGIYLQGQSNVVIGPGNTITQCDVGIMDDWTNANNSNLTIQGNHFSATNQDIQLGFYPAGTFTNVNIYGNDATNWVNWDEPGNGYHHNFVHAFTNLPGANLTGTLQIYNNKVIGDIGAHATSMIFLENNNGGSGGTMGTWYIFNNIFNKTNANVPTSSGIVAPQSDNGFLLNNTIIDAGGTGGNAFNCVNFYGTGWTMKNNVLIGCGTYVYQEGSSITATNNDYYGAASPQWIFRSTWSSSLSSWQASCNCDSSSIATNPNLTTSYAPNTGSPVIGAGQNLTSLGIAALTSDIAGSPRPGSGAWTLGAYGSGSGSTTGPLPPTGLTGTVIAK